MTGRRGRGFLLMGFLLRKLDPAPVCSPRCNQTGFCSKHNYEQLKFLLKKWSPFALRIKTQSLRSAIKGLRGVAIHLEPLCTRSTSLLSPALPVPSLFTSQHLLQPSPPSSQPSGRLSPPLVKPSLQTPQAP